MFCIAGHLVVAAPVFLAFGSGLLFSFNATTFEAKLIGFQILTGVDVDLELIIDYVVSAVICCGMSYYTIPTPHPDLAPPSPYPKLSQHQAHTNNPSFPCLEMAPAIMILWRFVFLVIRLL